VSKVKSEIPRFILSGGGTGGHLFPAIAIANALKERFENAEFLFVGARGKMEMEKVPASGYKIEGLNIAGLQRGSIVKNLTLPFKVISSLLKSYRILKRFKPSVSIGTGGYASAPLLFMASRMRIPTLIQEQNFFPGITNKILASRVNTICAVDESSSKYFPTEKMVVTGNPIRKNLLNIQSKEVTDWQSKHNLNAEKATLFITGGSLGSESINKAVEAFHEEWQKSGFNIVWQCGKNHIHKYKKYDQEGLVVFDFVDDMRLAYHTADLVLCRAGAITLAELAALRKACILVPSPYVAEDHQTKNARAFADKKAAYMIEEKHMMQDLNNAVENLMFSKEERSQLEQNMVHFDHPHALESIVSEIIKLLPHGLN